jgi:hypothetical protein
VRCVVHEEVEPAECLDRGLDHAPQIVIIQHVGLDRDCPDVVGLDRGDRLMDGAREFGGGDGRSPDDRHVGATSREFQRDGFADTPGRAGDERDTTGERYRACHWGCYPMVVTW